ncbi:MAG: AI-2E family transporter [Acidimicrobiales bacterium]
MPVAIALAAFYIVYRILEDYFVKPRVMKHTVKVMPGPTIIATPIGGSPLGLVGALVTIPVATTIRLLLEEGAFPKQNRG